MSFKWRNHDPAIGRFFNVDPLAAKYVYNSPYAFSENHVVAHRELEGLEKVSIHSSSFAPFKTFGGPYKGDGANRKFSTNPQASSRIRGQVNIDASPSGIKQGDVTATGSTSHNTWTGSSTHSPAEMKAKLGESTTGENSASAKLGFHLSGANKLVPGSPDIDAKGNMTITVQDLGDKGSVINFSGAITGDKFPANETFITDQSGTGVFLGVSGADGNPFTSLPGDNDRKMSEFNIGVQFDTQGNVQGVQYNGQTYTVEDWKFQSQNPQSGNTSTTYK